MISGESSPQFTDSESEIGLGREAMYDRIREIVDVVLDPALTPRHEVQEAEYIETFRLGTDMYRHVEVLENSPDFDLSNNRGITLRVIETRRISDGQLYPAWSPEVYLKSHQLEGRSFRIATILDAVHGLSLIHI